MTIALQRVHVEVAEVEPVGPRLMKGRVEAADFGYQVNLAGVAVLAFDAEHEAVHHLPQAAAVGSLSGA